MRMKIVSLFLVIFLINSFSAVQANENERKQNVRDVIRKRMLNDEKSQPESEGIAIRTDVPYAQDGHQLQTLDIYFPEKEESVAGSNFQEASTVLFHVHGGGWRIGDKKMMRKAGLFYAGKKILFITPNYRLSPGVQHPAHVEDCAAALAWVFEHLEELGGDNTRVYLSGHSAGAHLVSLLATNQKYLQKYGIAPEDLAGVISDDTASFDLINNDNERVVRGFIKTAFGEDKAILQEASPFYHLSERKKYPRFLVLNTTNRKDAVALAKIFVTKMKSVGGDIRFIPIANHTHKEMGTGIYDPLDPVAQEFLQFMGH